MKILVFTFSLFLGFSSSAQQNAPLVNWNRTQLPVTTNSGQDLVTIPNIDLVPPSIVNSLEIGESPIENFRDAETLLNHLEILQEEGILFSRDFARLIFHQYIAFDIRFSLNPSNGRVSPEVLTAIKGFFKGGSKTGIFNHKVLSLETSRRFKQVFDDNPGLIDSLLQLLPWVLPEFEDFIRHNFNLYYEDRNYFSYDYHNADNSIIPVGRGYSRTVVYRDKYDSNSDHGMTMSEFLKIAYYYHPDSTRSLSGVGSFRQRWLSIAERQKLLDNMNSKVGLRRELLEMTQNQARETIQDHFGLPKTLTDYDLQIKEVKDLNKLIEPHKTKLNSILRNEPLDLIGTDEEIIGIMTSLLSYYHLESEILNLLARIQNRLLELAARRFSSWKINPTRSNGRALVKTILEFTEILKDLRSEAITARRRTKLIKQSLVRYSSLRLHRFTQKEDHIDSNSIDERDRYDRIIRTLNDIRFTAQFASGAQIVETNKLIELKLTLLIDQTLPRLLAPLGLTNISAALEQLESDENQVEGLETKLLESWSGPIGQSLFDTELNPEITSSEILVKLDGIMAQINGSTPPEITNSSDILDYSRPKKPTLQRSNCKHNFLSL